eukprot:scaffold360_cov374-Pavlova_lutheri.AAC.77
MGRGSRRGSTSHVLTSVDSVVRMGLFLKRSTSGVPKRTCRRVKPSTTSEKSRAGKPLRVVFPPHGNPCEVVVLNGFAWGSRTLSPQRS